MAELFILLLIIATPYLLLGIFGFFALLVELKSSRNLQKPTRKSMASIENEIYSMRKKNPAKKVLKSIKSNFLQLHKASTDPLLVEAKYVSSLDRAVELTRTHNSALKKPKRFDQGKKTAAGIFDDLRAIDASLLEELKRVNRQKLYGLEAHADLAEDDVDKQLGS